MVELDALRADVAAAYDDAAAALTTSSGDGTLLQGEVLARWEDFVGTRRAAAQPRGQGRLAARARRERRQGKPQQAEQVTVAIESGLENLILQEAEGTPPRSPSAGAPGPQAPACWPVRPSSTGPPASLRRTAERAVREWQQDVTELVRIEGSGQRTARFLAYGVQGLAVALMVSALDQASTQPSSEAGPRLLEAVFGAESAAGLAARARDTLEYRLGDLLEVERRRWTAALDAVPVSANADTHLRQAARRVDDVRSRGPHAAEGAPSEVPAREESGPSL